MKKIFLLISSILYLCSFNAFALDQNDVDNMFARIESRFSHYSYDSQDHMYKTLKNKLFILKLKNKNHKNIDYIEDLFEKVEQQHNYILWLKNNPENKDKLCWDYQCFIKYIEKNKDIVFKAPLPDSIFIKTVHTQNQLNVKFNQDNISFKMNYLYDNITDEQAISKIKKKYTYNKNLTDKEIEQYLINSIDTHNFIRNRVQNCTIALDDKEKLINVFHEWSKWNTSTSDLDFAQCDLYEENNTDNKIVNKYKIDRINKKQLEKQKLIEKYKNELNNIEINLIDFKEEYNVWENITWEIEITQLPDQLTAIIYNDEMNYYYQWKDVLEIHEDWEYSSDKKYYNTQGEKLFTIWIYDESLLSSWNLYWFDREELDMLSLKSTFFSFSVIVNNDVQYINWVKLDLSYEDLWDNYVAKENEIFYLYDGKITKIEGLTKWEYKKFDSFIYTKDKLFFERFWEFRVLDLQTDYDSFESLYGSYYQDNNSIYYINDFFNTAQKIEKWEIQNISEWCFGKFIAVDKKLYQWWSVYGTSCDEIKQKYSDYEHIMLDN